MSERPQQSSPLIYLPPGYGYKGEWAMMPDKLYPTGTTSFSRMPEGEVNLWFANKVIEARNKGCEDLIQEIQEIEARIEETFDVLDARLVAADQAALLKLKNTSGQIKNKN